MTTAVLPQVPVAADEELSPPSADDPGTRGDLVFRHRAVERVLSLVAAEVEGADGTVPRVLGQRVGAAGERPRVHAEVSGDLVTARLEISVPWPTPVARVADAVRQAIRSKVPAMTGLRVGHLDLVVTGMPLRGRPAAPPPRVV